MVKNVVVFLFFSTAILSVVSYVLAAPVVAPPSKSRSVKASHITKGDVLLLKEKLAALEADLEQLEPEVPTEESPIFGQEYVTSELEENEEEEVEPEQTQADEERHLRKLVIQALTAIYREDADRIGQMLDNYYSKIASSAAFLQKTQPAPKDLSKTVELEHDVHIPETESGFFLNKPFNEAELDNRHEQKVDSSRNQLIASAEQKLVTDIEGFEDQGLALEELLADLEDKVQDDERINMRNSMEETEPVTDTVLFGGNTENEADKENKDDDELSAEELLKELMANLDSSLNNRHGNKIPTEWMM